MPSCIYCSEEKEDVDFNREHVIPDSFGAFENNLVITCVCKACNDFFGRELDMKLARDSAEGIDRFRWGLKSTHAFKSMGRSSTTHIEVAQSGPMKGVSCRLIPSADGRTFDAEPLPQIGFAWDEDGPFAYHSADALPFPADVIASPERRDRTICTRGCGA